MARNLSNHARVVMYSMENEMRNRMSRKDPDLPALEAGFVGVAARARN